MTKLLVELPGRHANQVIAYLSSRYLQTKYGFGPARYSNLLTFMGAPVIDHSRLMTPADAVRCRLTTRRCLRGHSLSGEKVRPLLSSDVAVVKGFFQRCDYFYEPHRLFFEERGEWARSRGGRDAPDLTVHVRGGDVWSTRRRRRVHADYPALPLSFYRGIRDDGSWRTVRVVTDDPGHSYTRAVAEVFGAEVQSLSRDEDLIELARARNLVLSVSTFALLGALASTAEQVFFPRVGLFGVRHDDTARGQETPQLLPSSRSDFTPVEVRSASPWRGSHQDLEYVLGN